MSVETESEPEDEDEIEFSTEETDVEPDVVTVEHHPFRLSAHLAMAAGLVATVASAPFVILSLPFSLLGLGTLAAGLYVAESRLWVSVGAGGIFTGAIIAGIFGLTPELMLLSVIGVMVAWDTGQNAISIGEQLATGAHARRLQLVHTGLTAIVATMAAGIAYGLYLTVPGGYPIQSLGLLILGPLILLWAIRR